MWERHRGQAGNVSGEVPVDPFNLSDRCGFATIGYKCQDVMNDGVIPGEQLNGLDPDVVIEYVVRLEILVIDFAASGNLDRRF